MCKVASGTAKRFGDCRAYAKAECLRPLGRSEDMLLEEIQLLKFRHLKWPRMLLNFKVNFRFCLNAINFVRTLVQNTTMQFDI